jgi:hypothetical protein
MSDTVTFGIVGGYGATGRAVVSELWKSCNGEILIGGRDLAKGSALAAEFDRSVSAAHLDALDSRSLEDFCSRSSIIVNCAGPLMVLEDRVAQAALRQRCHYIDPGGFSFVKERLLPHSREIAELRLSFILSAGWIPGISEVLPAYADAQARTEMDTVESVAVYFGDGSQWSTTALRDGVWYIRHGLRSAGHFHKGEWVRANPFRAYPRADLGGRLGSGRFCMFSAPEMDEVGRRLNHCDFFAYSYLAGFRVVINGALIALLPLPEQWGVRLVRNVFRSARLPVGGFVVVRATGRSEGRRLALTVRSFYDEYRQYWANGLVPAILARMLSEGKGVNAGVHFLADAVDPIAFMTELRKSGLEQTENFGPCEPVF